MRENFCTICNTQPDKRGLCGCEPPFDLRNIPQHKLDGLARSLYKTALSYFVIPENQAKYEKWLEERNGKQATISV